jgi:hypothetical protein
MRSVLDRAKVGYEPGIFCAFAAMVLLVAAVWLAAGAAGRADTTPAGEAIGPARPAEDTEPAAAAPAPTAPPPSRIGPTGRAGFADGLTVTSTRAIEPSSSTDILRG